MKTCPGCKQEIDPDTCQCGEPIQENIGHDNHNPVPMGCECHYRSVDELFS